MKILLGVTGSVAAILTPKLTAELLKDHEAQVIGTKHSFYFWDPKLLPVKVWHDEDEWPGTGYIPESPILHIELRKWADILLIAPISANTLAKIANGIADNLITSVVRAWDKQKPIILAPAMNTQMWKHPATGEHIRKLSCWYSKFAVINPAIKLLACGDFGEGAMADIKLIVSAVGALGGK